MNPSDLWSRLIQQRGTFNVFSLFRLRALEYKMTVCNFNYITLHYIIFIKYYDTLYIINLGKCWKNETRYCAIIAQLICILCINYYTVYLQVSTLLSKFWRRVLMWPVSLQPGVTPVKNIKPHNRDDAVCLYHRY